MYLERHDRLTDNGEGTALETGTCVLTVRKQ